MPKKLKLKGFDGSLKRELKKAIMGQITEALNKIQRLRENHPEPKTAEFSRGVKPVNSRVVVVTIVAVGIVAVVFVSIVVIALNVGNLKSNQNEFYTLENSFKEQEKGVNELMAFVIKANVRTDNQLQSLDSRINNETENRRDQVNNLTLTDNAYYLNLVKSILANTNQINYLDKYTKSLNSQIVKTTKER